ncbi:aliphatic sulfonate ABC transporter substrate-binding protein [Acetobacter sp. DsW_063]|nr:aliphatic sulfonate ABC transporter substrate-binding protein [Acetobacter sp. DsW_063]
MVTAIAAKALDFGYVGDATATFAFASGRPLKVITVWQMGGDSSAIVIPKDSTARSMRDLVGHRVAYVKGSPGHLLVLAALKRENLSPEEILATPLTAANARTALASGSIDAWAIWDPYVATVELEDNARPLLTAKGLVEEVECGVANESAVALKRDQLLDFLSRVGRAAAWSDSHQEERARAFSADTGVPLDVARLTVSRQRFTPLSSVTDHAVAVHQHVADLYQAAGVIPSRIEVAQFYDRSFVIAQ